MEAGFPDSVTDLIEYARDLGQQHTAGNMTDRGADDTSIVMQTVVDLLAVASDQPLPKVNYE